MKKGVMKKILMKKLSLESEPNKKVSEDQKQRILKYLKKYYIMQKTDFKLFMKCSYNLHNSCNLHNLYNLITSINHIICITHTTHSVKLIF